MRLRRPCLHRHSDDPQLWWVFPLLSAAMLVLGVLSLLGGGVANVVGGVTELVFACTYAAQRHNYRSAYRRGWFAAREVMWRSLAEAKTRRMSLAEWMKGEQDRDVVTMIGGF